MTFSGMEIIMHKILVVSHCILNTASKVISYNEAEQREEAKHRRNLLEYIMQNDIQLVQLPCPELLMYGTKRWGHVKDQFDNPFFRSQCRQMLEPMILQIKEYADNPERFQLEGIVAIDLSPSCGYHVTCKGDWGGEFSGCPGLEQKLETLSTATEPGVFMEELAKLLEEAKLSVPILDLSSF
jgi:predicted secreted protein